MTQPLHIRAACTVQLTPGVEAYNVFLFYGNDELASVIMSDLSLGPYAGSFRIGSPTDTSTVNDMVVPDLATGIDYIVNYWQATLVSDLNTYLSGASSPLVYVYDDYSVFNASTEMALDGKQSLNSNLTQIAGIASPISADVISLMGLSNYAAMATAMGVTGQVNADWNATSGLAEILHKPTLFSGAYSDLTGKPSLFSGAYTDLSGKPTLFSGAWTDLTGKPAFFSGNYVDLSGKPTLATVATTGAYADLTGKPSIPAAQVQSDWNASTGLGVILNKPDIPSTARTTTSQSMSLVGTGATGTQISSTKDSQVRFTVSTSTTATIGGASTSNIVLKKCATNSATESDWATMAEAENTQTITLAIILQSLQGTKQQLVGDIPAAWFCKLVNSGSGTHAETFIRGEKTVFG